MGYSFGILKPDSVERKLVPKIFGILKKNGFKIVAKRRFRFTRENVAIVYGRAIGQSHFEPMCDFLISGDSIAILVEHHSMDAIRILNDLVGNTNPRDSKDGTIRKLGESIRRNLIHSTADSFSFAEETRIFFSESELKEIGCDL